MSDDINNSLHKLRTKIVDLYRDLRNVNKEESSKIKNLVNDIDEKIKVVNQKKLREANNNLSEIQNRANESENIIDSLMDEFKETKNKVKKVEEIASTTENVIKNYLDYIK